MTANNEQVYEAIVDKEEEKIAKDNLVDIFYLVEDEEERLNKEIEEERKRMYRLNLLFLNALEFVTKPEVKQADLKEEFNKAYEDRINPEEEEAYVYDEDEKNFIQGLRESLQAIKDTYITPFVKHVRIDVPEKINEFVKGTWGHLHASYVKAKEDGVFKTYAWKGATYAPVSDFTTEPSFENEVAGGPTKVFINDELHALDQGNDLIVYGQMDINKAMLDLEKIYKEDGLRFISLEKGMSVETARSYLVAATLLKQADINLKCIIADKTLRDEILTPEFVAELKEIEESFSKPTKEEEIETELAIDKEALESAIGYVDYLKEEKLLKDSLDSAIGYAEYLKEEKLLKEGLDNATGYVDYLAEEKLLKEGLESGAGYAEYLKDDLKKEQQEKAWEKAKAQIEKRWERSTAMPESAPVNIYDVEDNAPVVAEDEAPKYDPEKAWEKTEAQINKRWERSTAMPESAPVNIYDVEDNAPVVAEDEAPKYDPEKAWEKTEAQINKRWERSTAMPESAPVNIYDVEDNTPVVAEDEAPKYDPEKAWEKTEAQINKRWERSTAMPESAPVNIYDVPEEAPEAVKDEDIASPELREFIRNKAWEKDEPENAPEVPEGNVPEANETEAVSGAEAVLWDEKTKKSAIDNLRAIVKKELASNLEEGYLTNKGQEEVIENFEKDALNCFSGVWEEASQIIKTSEEKVTAREAYDVALKNIKTLPRQTYEGKAFLIKVLEEKQKQRSL